MDAVFRAVEAIIQSLGKFQLLDYQWNCMLKKILIGHFINFCWLSAVENTRKRPKVINQNSAHVMSCESTTFFMTFQNLTIVQSRWIELWKILFLMHQQTRLYEGKLTLIHGVKFHSTTVVKAKQDLEKRATMKKKNKVTMNAKMLGRWIPNQRF